MPRIENPGFPVYNRGMRRATTIIVAGLLLPLAAAVCVGAGPATAPAGPSFDDPRYAAWAGFKPGSSESFAGDLTMQGRPAHITVKMTLVAVTTDAVELETVTTVQPAGGGQPVTLRPQKQTIAAKTDQLSAVRPLPNRDVKAMDRTYPCRVLDLVPAHDDAAGSHKTTVCLNDHVPGGVVQIEAPQAGKRVTMTLTAYEAK